MKSQVVQETAWNHLLSKIRERLAQPSETQASVARILGVNRSVVYKWLSGDLKGKRVSVDDMRRYFASLGLDPEPYFGKDDTGEFIQVPWMEAEASMGGGPAVVSKHIISHLSFRADWLLQKGNYKKMAIINAGGSSMEPTIPDESIVLINEAKTHPPVNGKIYFVCYDGELFLKRLKVHGERVEVLISDNGNTEIPIDPSVQFEILGRAIWFGKEL